MNMKISMLLLLVVCAQCLRADDGIEHAGVTDTENVSTPTQEESGNELINAPSMPFNLSVVGRVLEDDYEGMFDVLWTVHDSASSSLSLDLRASFLEDREQEVNAGLVFRRLGFNGQAILGLNAYYDYRWTEQDHEFDQAGAGIELLSTWIDFRANYYHPLGDAEVISEDSTISSTRVGNKKVTVTDIIRSYEEPLPGFDAELGVWLPIFTNYIQTAIYGGYFDFDSDYVDDRSFSGFKARVEARLNRYITLDYEWLEEGALNESEHIAGVRFHVQLGSRAPTASTSHLSSRMYEMINRDFRIRTINTGPVAVGQSTQEQIIRQPEPEPIVCRDVFVTDPITGVTTLKVVCE